jgi:hypothetical protein
MYTTGRMRKAVDMSLFKAHLGFRLASKHINTKLSNKFNRSIVDAVEGQDACTPRI